MVLTTSDVTGYDARFPQMNQYVNFHDLRPNSSKAIANSPLLSRTKHCWQNYVDYHKCVTAKGEDFRPCRQVCHFSPYPRPRIKRKPDLHVKIDGLTIDPVLPRFPLPVPQGLD